MTKKDVLELFMTRVHPSSSKRSKLAVHMRSQKPNPQKISTAAAQAFESIVRAQGVASIEEGGWQSEIGSDPPTVAAFAKYWQKVLVESGLTPEAMQELSMKMPALMEKYPAEVMDDNAVREGATYIENVSEWKEGLAVSDKPKPLVEWGDLPISKY